jgi:UDP-glucose 4-epimerase
VIYGDAHTIRDYVLASDIGNFVAERLVDQAYGAQVFFLVSGKPSSTVEILRKVELAVGRKMYLKFDARPSNASDNSFSQDVLPTGWRPTDPDTGIRQTTRQLMSSFIKART